VQGRESDQQSAQGFGIAQANRGGVATVNITQVYQAATPTPILAGELEAAEQRLQMLPLDDVPAPAGLPPGSWMPLRRNALFVGREDALRALASALEAGGTAAVGQRAALTGLGGVGKSQLASEFVYRYGQYFCGRCFLAALCRSRGNRGRNRYRRTATWPARRFREPAIGYSGQPGDLSMAQRHPATAGTRQLRD
jgi:hypothetical protein